MEYVTGVARKKDMEFCELFGGKADKEEVVVKGAVHVIRDMKEEIFIVLRKKEGLLQCVYHKGEKGLLLDTIQEGCILKARGNIREEKRAPGGVELHISGAELLSSPEKAVPLPVGKWKLTASLETKMQLRPISLRNLRERAKFRIKEGIVRGFRDYLYQQGFTEIHTPKINAKGAEGGSNLFKLDYFGKKAVLAQSPQLYKQMMVGVFDRVLEVGPVFRAEKHNTKRHLNEYTGLDFEMGYIESFYEIMEMETGFLQYMTGILEQDYQKELQLLHIRLPKVDRIPAIRFSKAKELAAEKYGREIRNPYDLEPEEEALIGRYFKEEENADFVFITHYPSKKRPFYAMDDPANPFETLSFDLLYGGLEVTTGGQRIHDYHMLRKKIAERGMSEEGLESYLMAFQYGMPPHGGLGIGLERFAMKLCGEENVRETSLFPRDMHRLDP